MCNSVGTQLRPKSAIHRDWGGDGDLEFVQGLTLPLSLLFIWLLGMSGFRGRERLERWDSTEATHVWWLLPSASPSMWDLGGT